MVNSLCNPKRLTDVQHHCKYSTDARVEVCICVSEFTSMHKQLLTYVGSAGTKEPLI